MKITKKLANRLTLLGCVLCATWVTTVSASSYAYPQHPAHTYGAGPGQAVPGYGMPYPYHRRQMQQVGSYGPAASAPQQTAQESTDSATVTIAQMRFEPSIITVKVGEKVTWKQSGNMPHTVTANDRSFTSQRLQYDGEFSQTFDQPGIHSYYCSLHPSMQGVVKVVE